MKIRTIVLSLIATSLLTGCISKKQINSQIQFNNDPQFASNVCFDIGNGFNSNTLTDDYWEELNVNDGLSCTEALADRRELNDEERAAYMQKSLAISSKKSFLPNDVLQNINTEYQRYNKLLRTIIAKKNEQKAEKIAQAQQAKVEKQLKQKNKQNNRLKEIAREMLGDRAANDEGGLLMRNSICLDASFKQGLNTYKKFQSNWEQVTLEMDKDYAIYVEFKGRDFRKQQMTDANTDRDNIRVMNWYSLDCEALM
ncbi:hypothetical protein ACRN9T_12705 [Shewanella baltica]|uniref:hypothetical protein n=1 Tax=Shewanella baltica TaxID=62322 RepID=UPI003D78D24F